MDADRYGIKRIKEVVGEDGSVVIRVYLLDPRQQSKRSDGSLSTDGYMLLAETKPIKPGEWNSQDLVVKKHLLEQFHIQKLIQKLEQSHNILTVKKFHLTSKSFWI